MTAPVNLAELMDKVHRGVIAHQSLPVDAYPFTVAYLHPVTREPLATITVISPTVLVIPPVINEPVIVRMTFADGDVVETPPPVVLHRTDRTPPDTPTS